MILTEEKAASVQQAEYNCRGATTVIVVYGPVRTATSFV